jgi:hypothetical protein
VSAEQAGGAITVEIAWSPAARQTLSISLQLPAGSSALAALRASGLAERLGAALLDGLVLALWGRVVGPDAVLHEGDRLELLRGLQVDPKEARRQRYRRDGIKPKRKGPRRSA